MSYTCFQNTAGMHEAFSSQPELPSFIPRGFGRERYVLHLFSGRRRQGDLQFFLDRMQRSDEPFFLRVVSLDVVLSDVRGDLLKPSTRAFWKDAIRQRFVVALLGGPPCETWSQARERQAEKKKHAPRVLRTAAMPWGKESLSLREMRQLCVGNSLMGFQLEAEVELYCVGGVAFTEHPAKPKDTNSVSIWSTPILQLLSNLPGFELIDLSHGLWGAKSRKPTTLLALNALGVQHEFKAWQVTSDVPTATSIGRIKLEAGPQWL